MVQIKKEHIAVGAVLATGIVGYLFARSDAGQEFIEEGQDLIIDEIREQEQNKSNGKEEIESMLSDVTGKEVPKTLEKEESVEEAEGEVSKEFIDSMNIVKEEKDNNEEAKNKTS